MNKEIKAVIFDLDGTIYFGGDLAEGALELLEYLGGRNMEAYYLTNNSTKNRAQIHKKLEDMGISCPLERVYSSVHIAARYLVENKMDDIYVVGSQSLKDELVKAGLRVTEEESEAAILLIGLDTKIDYEEITRAGWAALNCGKIVVCNLDQNFPGDQKKLYPGCGAIVAAIMTTTGREPDVIIGKPSTLMVEYLAAEHDLDREEILMVGDGYGTDIAMAKAYGCRSVYVGEESHPDTLCVRELKEILPLFNKGLL